MERADGNVRKFSMRWTVRRTLFRSGEPDSNGPRVRDYGRAGESLLWAMRPSASRCWPGKARLWRWWRRISLRANCTGPDGDYTQRSLGTRSDSGRLFSKNRKLHCDSRAHSRRSRSSHCSSATRSSISWRSLGSRIWPPAVILPTISSFQITNRERRLTDPRWTGVEVFGVLSLIILLTQGQQFRRYPSLSSHTEQLHDLTAR